MNTDSSSQPEMFSREWYDKYFNLAASSQAHSQFCKRLYGEDLCQLGGIDVEELDFLVSLIEPNSKILEIGCSNGYVAERIHDRTSSTILGIDFSGVAVAQARERTTSKAKGLRFEEIDLAEGEIPGSGYDYIIAMDSCYFLEEYGDFLLKANEQLGDGGKMIIAMFQSELESPGGILGAERTRLGRVLEKRGFRYKRYELTEKARAYGIKSQQVAEEMREAFIRESNEFLYEARVAQSAYWRENIERDKLVRLMFVVDKRTGEEHSA